MKIEKTLNVPSPVFFDKIIDSVIFDIRKATGKTVSRKQLAGYEYVKERQPKMSLSFAMSWKR